MSPWQHQRPWIDEAFNDFLDYQSMVPSFCFLPPESSILPETESWPRSSDCQRQFHIPTSCPTRRISTFTLRILLRIRIILWWLKQVTKCSMDLVTIECGQNQEKFQEYSMLLRRNYSLKCWLSKLLLGLGGGEGLRGSQVYPSDGSNCLVLLWGRTSGVGGRLGAKCNVHRGTNLRIWMIDARGDFMWPHPRFPYLIVGVLNLHSPLVAQRTLLQQQEFDPEPTKEVLAPIDSISSCSIKACLTENCLNPYFDCESISVCVNCIYEYSRADRYSIPIAQG